ncbi:43 kDa receptor-associated protein of the synapse homolog [Teleopsis dalmanni]|uniref:43 kDa receptor-associated protein of the synapse homolog n=1 Tax=Teleopsis dalmanni TaxID=139649 RepID=UPI0018CEE985|nr:43 kDa receptor-associated protein of the synapse homolog [Teleopsis dalmanni]
MSWESVVSKDLLSFPHCQNLSATHLLASPDGSRNLLEASNEFCNFDENYSWNVGYGSSPEENSLWAHQGFSAPRNSVVNCFLMFQRSLKQYLAKRKMERGLRLYEQHNQNAAVRIWRSALKATSRREDCFQLLNYLYQAHMDWGKFREAIEFGHRALGISEELDSQNMRAETYLNLARAHERLGGLERALSYARHSLYNECNKQCRTGGLVHLTVARVYLEMGGFSRALEGLQNAHKIALSITDPSLELQVFVALSELFGRLQDNHKSAVYASKAYDLSRSLQLGHLNSSNHRAALLRMAAALRKQGELGDAHDYCMEATRLSLISGDQATYTRSLRIMGDIYRKKMDIDRAFRQYELAMGTSSAVGDRMAQMEAMDGAARCLEVLRLQQKICNCRPLEFNTRLLEVANSIGAKLLMRKVRSRLSLIYQALGDDEQYNTHIKLASQTDAALGLICGVCGELFGLETDSLEALPCAHILHARCAHELIRKREKGSNRACPACNKLINSHLHLCSPENNRSMQNNILNSNLQINTAELIPPLYINESEDDNDNNSIVYTDNIFCNGLSTNTSNNSCSNILISAKRDIEEPTHRSNLSLESLSMHASSLNVNSGKNATSSV